MPKLKTRAGFIYNEDDVIIGTLTDSSTVEIEATIEAGSEALEAIKNFVEGTKKGSLKAKKTYDSFRALLDKYEIEYA